LGMGKLKGELEDLAFPYVYPREYRWLKTKIKDQYQEREAYLKKTAPILKKKLKQEKINYLDIHTRAKRYYSLYKKLEQHDMDFGKIYDLVALRIIVPNIKDCYAALGAIHKYWKPLPGRIKDYIAAPKPNGYQSLHTTIFCIEGKITEIQIRTPQIHWEVEHGVAAHWARPKEVKTRYYGIKKAQLEWIEEIKKWQKEIAKPKEFLKSLKVDFFKYRIFVFTPKGDVINLPGGATPVDFAYRIHTELGHRCGGAKVDGKIAPLNHPLHNGQIVEILARKEAGPSRDWLKFVKTNHAKTKIKNWFKVQREKVKEKTTKITEKKLKPKKEIVVQSIPTQPGLVKHKLKAPITVEGQNNLTIKLAKCCNPLPGEPILGYITTLKSITIHHRKCSNIINKKDRRKIVSVSWKSAVAFQPVTIEIIARDRIGLIKDITTALSKLRINITDISASEPSEDIALALITLEVVNINQLNTAQKELKKINGIWGVKRI